MTKKGFKVGFDIGLLYTGGATIEPVSGDGAASEDIRDFGRSAQSCPTRR